MENNNLKKNQGISKDSKFYKFKVMLVLNTLSQKSSDSSGHSYNKYSMVQIVIRIDIMFSFLFQLIFTLYQILFLLILSLNNGVGFKVSLLCVFSSSFCPRSSVKISPQNQFSSNILPHFLFSNCLSFYAFFFIFFFIFISPGFFLAGSRPIFPRRPFFCVFD